MLRFFLVILISFVMNGCSSLAEYGDIVISNVPGAGYFSDFPFAIIKIKSSKFTNGGAPFYVLVKETEFSTFAFEDYSKIVNLVINPPKNQPCFTTACIVPGKDQTIKIETTDASSIGIYFLFTHPGEKWKQFFELDGGFPTIKIVLEENEILSIGN